MRNFVKPEMDIIHFTVSDILTTSPNENDLPFTPFSNMDMLEHAE